MEHIVKIQSIENLTHDVKRFRLEKPAGYTFAPGQATDLSINTAKLKDEKRPFTFTGRDSDAFLEFTIKIYADHDGVTKALGNLQPEDELILRDVWGAIQYKGEGYFIAGGAGITPFIAILRDLADKNLVNNNTLFFSNKTADDIILKDELEKELGTNAVFITTRERQDAYHFGMINEAFLKARIHDFIKHFYICGPDKMVSDIQAILVSLGASPDLVVFEQ